MAELIILDLFNTGVHRALRDSTRSSLCRCGALSVCDGNGLRSSFDSLAIGFIMTVVVRMVVTVSSSCALGLLLLTLELGLLLDFLSALNVISASCNLEQRTICVPHAMPKEV